MSAARDGDTRDRILNAAATLLAESGGEPVSTRAICQAAGVGAPTLYHHFGDKQGLFDAVVSHGFDRYLRDKRAMPVAADPVDRLRDGWDLHVDFGRTHPAFYVLMYASAKPGHLPPAAEETFTILIGMLEDVARAGRLTVPPETAADMIQAASMGVVLTLITRPEASHEDLSGRTREALIAAVTTDPPASPDTTLAAQAIALDSTLDGAPTPLSPAETALLREWLRHLADH